MSNNRLAGKTVLVTAGPTRERLDPVRFLSNFSSGKMGYAIAEAALLMGARVCLITGPVALTPPPGVQIVRIESTLDLLREAKRLAPMCDIVIQAAAPADYRPAEVAPTKIKKQAGRDIALRLVENPDVAATIGRDKTPGQVFVAFAAETGDVYENAARKLTRKNADFIVANDVTQPGAGFNADTNIAAIIDAVGVTELPIMPKPQLARVILEKAAGLLGC